MTTKTPAKRRTTPTKQTRPWIEESSAIEADMKARHANAISAIDALDTDVLSIKERAQREMQAIQAVADAEVESRMRRRADLEKIIGITARALNIPEDVPPTNATVQQALADQSISETTSSKS